MSNPKEIDFQIRLQELDFQNCVAAAQSIEVAAEAMERLGKPEYEPAIDFIRTVALGMYAKATGLAEAEGLAPQRSGQELKEILEKQKLRFLN